MKTLHNTDSSGARQNVPDLKVWGTPDDAKLIFKASSEEEGWMKSTKAIQTVRGCIILVTTQQRNPDGSYSLAEACCFAPGTVITEQLREDGDVVGRRLL